MVSLMAVSFGSGRPNKRKMAFKEKTIREKSKKVLKIMSGKVDI